MALIPNSEGFCWFRDHNCSQHPSSCTETGWEEAWLLTVPVGFVGIVIMLLFAVSLCLLIYNIKNARIDRRALIELALFTAPFFVTITVTIVLLALNNYSSLTIIPFIPIAPMLFQLTLLVAIHLPFSFMFARMCLKRPRHSHTSGEFDRTTLQRSSNRPCTPPHSFKFLNEASEITLFVRDMQ